MTPLRVLHIDDESDIREVVAISLGLDPEFLVRGCASGKDGLAAAAEDSPDLILLDVMMPVMDGPTTLGHLRANPKTSGIPVIFMTARAQTREIDQFKSLGAAGVIAKPFDPMTLAATVRSLIPAKDEDTLAASRIVFLKRLSSDAEMLLRCRPDVEREFTPTSVLLTIRDIAHGLAGAGGIFGFAKIGDAAADLEEAAIIGLNGVEDSKIACTLERLLASIPGDLADKTGTVARKFDA